jgi:hypothetical protein
VWALDGSAAAGQPAAELKTLKCSQEVKIGQFAKQLDELPCQYFE